MHVQPWRGCDLRIPRIVILAVLLSLRNVEKLILDTQLLFDLDKIRFVGIVTR